MIFHLITIFPHIFDSYFNESIIKRAREKRLLDIKIHNLRDWTNDRHKTVDDSPFGGGPGMVMKVEPLYKAISEIKSKINPPAGGRKSKIILLSAKGKPWTQQTAKRYSKLDNLVLVCGRYEGVDERITEFIDEEISLGNYVLTGGEIGALAIVDSVARLLPGALGNAQSAEQESHAIPGLLEHPQYTRPEIFKALPLKKKGGKIKSYRVPKILLSGNHNKIKEWREQHSKRLFPL